jgi:hypothetical protein
MTTPEQLLERLEAVERASPGPPNEAGERVWAAIEHRLGNGPAPPDLDDGPLLDPTPELGAATSTGSSSMVLKVVGALAIVGVVGGGLALVLGRDPAPDRVTVDDSSDTPASTSPEPREPEVVIPEPVTPAPEVVTPEPEVVAPKPAKLTTSKPKPRSKPPVQAKSLADEVALMQALSTALKHGDSSKVLALVAEHERDFAKGQFIEERRAAKARALCQSGKLAAGTKEAERFATRWPSSIHLAAVDQDCGID